MAFEITSFNCNDADDGLNAFAAKEAFLIETMEKSTKEAAAGSKPFTTFVQTDTNNFREIVQRLTGASESNASQVVGVKRPTYELHERRQSSRPKLEIVKPGRMFHHHPCFSPGKSGTSSFLPSPVSGNSSYLRSSLVPSTILSKLAILDDEKRSESALPVLNREEEEKAIEERRFYLHPSPRSRQGCRQPELLTLFPLTSTKTSDKF